MEQRLLILTEASGEIGLGHVSRASNLVSHFEKIGFSLTWRIRGTTELDLKLGGDILFEEWASVSLLNHLIPHFNLVVVDVYRVEQSVLDYIANKSIRCLFIIDGQLKYGRPERSGSVSVLFSSAYAREQSVSSTVKFLGGKEYLLFKPNFYAISRNLVLEPYRIRLENIVINIGGFYDVALLKKIIRSIDAVYSGVKIDVLGKSTHDLQKISSDGRNSICFSFLSDYEYAAKLLNADLIVSNGGQSLNDALFLNRPCIVIGTANNQLENIEFWQRNKVIRYVGITNDVELRTRLEAEFQFFKELGNREAFMPLRHITFSENPAEKIFNVIFNTTST